MTKLRDGGPVYPFEYHNQTRTQQAAFFHDSMMAPGASQQFGGLTVRQYYAGLALQGHLASMRTCPECGPSEPVEFARAIARDCWKMADAMLATEHGGD